MNKRQHKSVSRWDLKMFDLAFGIFDGFFSLSVSLPLVFCVSSLPLASMHGSTLNTRLSCGDNLRSVQMWLFARKCRRIGIAWMSCEYVSRAGLSLFASACSCTAIHVIFHKGYFIDRTNSAIVNKDTLESSLRGNRRVYKMLILSYERFFLEFRVVVRIKIGSVEILLFCFYAFHLIVSSIIFFHSSVIQIIANVAYIRGASISIEKTGSFNRVWRKFSPIFLLEQFRSSRGTEEKK